MPVTTPRRHGRPVQLSAADLSQWLKAGANGEAIEFHSLGPIGGTLVTAGPDFLGIQTPHGPGTARAGRGMGFVAAYPPSSPSPGQFLEVGARYMDSRERPGSCPPGPALARSRSLVSADHIAVALPISQVLALGKFLVRLPD
jgi:hypothetical protein